MEKNQRKALLEQYKELKTYMGVVQITNEQNGKIYIAAYPNLKNKWLSIQSQLDMGRHMNASLQKDWDSYGKDAFSYTVLAEQATDDVADVRWEVKQLEKTWLAKLTPYGDKGYNKEKAPRNGD